MSLRHTQIGTGSGYFDFAAPAAKDVSAWDVAAALAKVCRFGGHCRFFYSVAEHSMLVRDLVVSAGHSELASAALLHDAHEAYVGDWPTPLKDYIKAEAPGVCERLARHIDIAIGKAFDVDPDLFHHPAVKEADLRALRAEAHALKSDRGMGWGLDHISPTLPKGLVIRGMHPTAAEAAFLDAHVQERSRA